MTMDEILVAVILTPALGAAVCLVLTHRLSRVAALAFSTLGLVLATLLYCRFDATRSGVLQGVVSYPWIPAWGARFALGVDGLSFPLVLLTKLVTPIALLASWESGRHTRAFMICYLLLDAFITLTFLATDVVLFYVGWEAMLVPMLLLIGVWGSGERIYAALKFFLFTFAGSVLMLAAFAWLMITFQAQHGVYSADIQDLYRVVFSPQTVFLGLNREEWVFWALAIAFLVKVPLFPLHTWLPDAHVQAPTGGSIILAAVLLKLGTYGLLRFVVPIASTAFLRFQPILVALSLIGIVYGAWVAYQQTDMKKLVAYSSVSHLGFVVLGIASLTVEGLTGAVLQMVNHGLSTGALFLLVGALYERRHSRQFSDFGGLAEVMPWFAIALVVVAASSMAVPGLNGFVGEFLVLFGAFHFNPLVAAVAVLGVIFGALYLLVLLKKVLFGPVTSAENRRLKDLNIREWAALTPLLIFIVLLGVRPGWLVGKIEKTLESYWSMALTPNRPVSVGMSR